MPVCYACGSDCIWLHVNWGHLQYMRYQSNCDRNSWFREDPFLFIIPGWVQISCKYQSPFYWHPEVWPGTISLLAVRFKGLLSSKPPAEITGCLIWAVCGNTSGLIITLWVADVQYQWLSDGHVQKCLFLCPVTNWNKCYSYSATGQGRKETLLTVFKKKKET